MADLHDPVNYKTSRVWQWATSTESNLGDGITPPSPWNPIDTTDAKNDSNYTPRDEDAATTTRPNVHLWLAVTYTDNVGLAQTVYAVSANIIKSRDDSNSDPVFVDDSPAVSRAEDTVDPGASPREIFVLQV